MRSFPLRAMCGFIAFVAKNFAAMDALHEGKKRRGKGEKKEENNKIT